jgi:hypothetical protein
MLPSPTRARHVSGKKRRMRMKTTAEVMVRNQKIDLHLIRKGSQHISLILHVY